MVHPSLAVKGGAENVVIWLASELTNRGHSVSIYTLEYDENLWADVNPRLNVYSLQMKNTKLNWIKAVLLFVIRYRRELKRFDMVNPHLVPSYIWVSVAKKLSSNFPRVVWYCHEPPRALYAELIDEFVLKEKGACRRGGRKKILRLILQRLYRVIDRFGVNSIDLILSNSQFTAGWIEKIYKEKAKVCWPGVPIEGLTSGQITKERYVLTVGKMLPLKNIESVLEAVSVIVKNKLLKNLSGFKLKLVGEGPEEDRLRSYAKRAGIDDYVDFLGFVSDSDLPKIYAQSSAVIATSLNEPFGLTIIEAMLSKRAVVASNQGGPSEIVVDEVTGFLVDPLNPRKIAEALAKLINQPELANKMGEVGYKRAIKHFTLQKFVDRFEKALAEG